MENIKMEDLIIPVPSLVSTNYCVNCKFCASSHSGDSKRYACLAPQNMTGVDLVTGNKVARVLFCYEHRTDVSNDPNYCGAEGKWFEQRPVYKVPESPITTKDVTIASLAKLKSLKSSNVSVDDI